MQFSENIPYARLTDMPKQLF